MELLTNTVLDGGDVNANGGGASDTRRVAPGADQLEFLVPSGGKDDDQQTARRAAEAVAYRTKAAGRMFGSPSVAQRTYHEGAHVATTMGTPATENTSVSFRITLRKQGQFPALFY